ncbi:MAG: hypothetical protein JNK82_28470 [Myxococcaceae bacterium]|nr:hypothetical protein [Myxococcaceae bacterium]
MRRSVVLLLVTACAHEKLVVPARDAPLEERQKAYAELKPKGVSRAKVRGRVPEPGVWDRALVLANGINITEPVDLLQAVPADSATATAIAAYEKKNALWHFLGPLAGYGFGVGATVVTAGIVANLTSTGPGAARDFGVYGTLTGAIVMLAVPITAVVLGWLLVPNADVERKAAWGAYHGDLVNRLDLPLEEAPPETPSEPAVAPEPPVAP